MRLNFTLLSLVGLSLAASGCDKQSGQGAQGAGNAAANAVTSGEVTSGEVTGGEVTSGEVTSGEAPSGGNDAAADQSFKHIVDRSHKGDAMPDKSFTGPDGQPTTLAKVAAGKPLLVNLWATWCAPCVAELPELDRLAATPRGIGVIAVSQDQGLPAHVDSFLAQHSFTTLKRYLDPDNALGFFYNTGTLPTTVLYDAKGKEVGRIVGALDWAGPEGQGLVKEIGG